ncbi:3-phenylpropionate/trans-cinnamate dioxygenase ferredoxin reductase subunit [Pseudonocardia cypriaca]|uniref:3-phenylpropionate/trans-cinnamate dioxygenase ferredoxin reductase subunit n=2 Tax=Pseudonocardia cypriaca TaxID=882449 RepID=A0A543FW45_9PSEU|nr:3-phenylpropionate/trans-cinnamate dioxygenase ferredoxin reductase subunit [Pseudonocardia cypriaca]
MHGVVVIGAGHAGVEAAASLRAGGYSGPVTVVGAERHLPYQRPPLSKEMLADGGDPGALALRSEAFFADRGIVLRHGPAVDVDRARQQVHIAGDRPLDYDHLVLATGAAPRRIELPGRSLRGVAELRTLDDALALRASLVGAGRMVVLGGGFIGMEVASAARKRGVDVSVVELADRLLGRAVSPPVSAAVAAHHRADGVGLCFGEHATELVGDAGHVTGVRTGSGRVLPADLVVLGIGATAEDGLARRAGLATDGGVLVDRWLTTSDPRIIAIGDCAVVCDPATGTRRRLESIQNATDHGRYAAARILGEERPYCALPWFWSNQGALRLQLVGIAGDSAELVVRGDAARFSVFCMRDGRLTAVESVNDPGTHMAARRLLERATPGEAELVAVDYDVRALARRVLARETAVA